MVFLGYPVSSLVATGSTGSVWRAEQPDLGRSVAIKELSPGLLRTPGFLDRFRTEARILAELDNPHVVRVYDYVETEGRAYLVQEWVEGAPLSDLLQRYGRLAPEQALGVLRGALTGLAHAHARGLVHRDISPSNVLVDGAGTSKLVDFGLAVPTGVSDPVSGATGASTSVVGTPGFASPEAVSGAAVTARSDVYSAGALLFLLLSGRLPYAGHPAEVARMHATAGVPRLTDVGAELAGLVARAMAKDPSQRPADAAEFLAGLEGAAERSHGAGWLARSSIAGLVGGSAVAVGAAALPGGAAAVGGLPAVTSAASAVTPSALSSGAAQVGGRVLGLPRLAVAVAGVVVVAAATATAFALTRADDGGTDTNDAAGRTSVQPAAETEVPPTTTAPPTTAPPTTPPPVPAFDGTYTGVQVLVGRTGATADDFEIGESIEFTIQVSSTCSGGVCDVDLAADGVSFTYTYAAGAWTSQRTYDAECFDDNGSGAPTGVIISVNRTTLLRPTSPLDAPAGSPIPSLSGTRADQTDSDCDGNPATYDYTLTLTRTGD